MDLAASSSVLRVVVENLVYPVSLDALCQVIRPRNTVPVSTAAFLKGLLCALPQIFSKFGTVLRIIVFTKNGQFQALLQYPDTACAQAAKLVSTRLLQARCRIGGCSTDGLNVCFSPWTARTSTMPAAR